MSTTQANISTTLPPCPEETDASMEVIGLRSDNLLIPGLTCIPKTTTTTTPEHEKDPRAEVTPPKSTSTTQSSILTTQSKATTTQSIYLPDEPITTDSDR